jgi:hypothetical protein
MSNKQFSLIRNFVNTSNRARQCIICGSAATQEALFDVGNGMSIIERYCDLCIKNVDSTR